MTRAPCSWIGFKISKYPRVVLLPTCFNTQSWSWKNWSLYHKLLMWIHTQQSTTTLWVDGDAHRTVAIYKLKVAFYLLEELKHDFHWKFEAETRSLCLQPNQLSAFSFNPHWNWSKKKPTNNPWKICRHAQTSFRTIIHKYLLNVRKLVETTEGFTDIPYSETNC